MPYSCIVCKNARWVLNYILLNFGDIKKIHKIRKTYARTIVYSGSDNQTKRGQAKEFLVFIYLFGVLRRLQHCTGHITTGSWKGRGNQYIQFVRVLYCKLPTNGKQLLAFPLEAIPGN